MKLFKRQTEVDFVKEKMVPPGHALLGEKIVSIPKLTPAMWKELMRTLDKLPMWIMQILSAPTLEDLQVYIVGTIDVAFDELVRVASVLSGLDEEYLEHKAGANEIYEFLRLTAEKNDLDKLAKNVISLVRARFPEETNEAEAMEN